MTVNHEYIIDIQSPVVLGAFGYDIVKGDAESHLIQITLLDNGAVLNPLTANLYVMRLDGETVITAMNVTDNVCSVAMPVEDSAITGRIYILVKASTATETLTVLAKYATVKDGITDVIVDPGDTIPSLDNLLAQIADCEAATLAAEEAAAAITGVTAEATTLETDVPATATAEIDPEDGHINLVFGLPKGGKGDIGAKAVSVEFSGDDMVFTLDDESTVTLEDAKIDLKGDTGDRTTINHGTAITGTSTTPTAYATGITLAVIGDTYIYNGGDQDEIGNEYICTLGGNAATALWIFLRNNRGPAGAGDVSSVNDVTPDVDGNVELAPADIDAATSAQGALADTAIQPGDVINDLTHTDTDKPLSAGQGKALNDAKAAKATTPTVDHISTLDASGNPKDSGHVLGDYTPIAAAVPTGGTTGQAPLKTSASDYAIAWSDIGRYNPPLGINWMDMRSPVNQRGIVSGASITTTTQAGENGYFLDGFIILAGTVIWTSNTSLYMAAGAKIMQFLEINYKSLLGQTATFCIQKSDLTYTSVTVAFPSSVSGATIESSVTMSGVGYVRFGFAYRSSGVLIGMVSQLYVPYVSFEATVNTTLVAMKPESGNVSTLPYCGLRDRATISAVCQRTYWRGGLVMTTGYMYAASAQALMYGGSLNFHVSMRDVPTMTIITTPICTGCGTVSLGSTVDGFVMRVTTDAAGIYRAYNGVYAARAEIT